MMIFLNNLYNLALDAAFWLVIGLFIGGLFKTLIPHSFLQKHLSHEGFSSVLKAALLGAPLPLCSCGVIPAAMSLRDAGASKSATTSFLVSTPETGVDSVLITYAMMGPFMAVVRPIIAILSAITTGGMVAFWGTVDAVVDTTQDKNENKTTTQSCCSSEKVAEKSCCATANKTKTEEIPNTSCCASETSATDNKTEDSCCATTHNTPSKEQSLLTKITSGITYAFTDLLDNIIFWLVIGIVFAAVVGTFVPHDLLIEYGTGLTGMVIMLVVGIPMYVCATASTPLAAGFLLAGISPGAVIVFLLAGPATNMATLGIINQQMGKRTMYLYLLGIMSTALISGFVVNYLVQLWQIDITQHLSGQQHSVPVAIQLLSLILLSGLSLRKFLRKN